MVIIIIVGNTPTIVSHEQRTSSALHTQGLYIFGKHPERQGKPMSSLGPFFDPRTGGVAKKNITRIPRGIYTPPSPALRAHMIRRKF